MTGSDNINNADDFDAVEQAVLRQAVNDMSYWITHLPAESTWRFAFEEARAALEDDLAEAVT